MPHSAGRYAAVRNSTKRTGSSSKGLLSDELGLLGCQSCVADALIQASTERQDLRPSFTTVANQSHCTDLQCLPVESDTVVVVADAVSIS